MCHLVLIRHSQSKPEPSIPANQWGLTGDGRQRCQRLPELLAGYRYERVYASAEPKAIQTVENLAVPVEVIEDLGEHDRSNVPWMNSKSAFDELVKKMFRQPKKLVFGTETAHQAVERFSHAIYKIIASNAGSDVLVATHGTVMTLFVCQYNQLDPIPFWSNLGMPAIVVLVLPSFELLSVARNV